MPLRSTHFEHRRLASLSHTLIGTGMLFLVKRRPLKQSEIASAVDYMRRHVLELYGLAMVEISACCYTQSLGGLCTSASCKAFCLSSSHISASAQIDLLNGLDNGALVCKEEYGCLQGAQQSITDSCGVGA